MTQRFDSRRAVVTGGAQGIGQAVAMRLAREGARVLVADIDAQAAAHTADQICSAGGIAASIGADVSDRAQVADMFALAVSSWSGVDILVSNAGRMDRLPFLEMTDQLWAQILSVNLTGAFLCGQLAARQMVAQGTGGRIVNIASNSGIFGGRGRAAYGASKAGIINLTQTMAIELAAHNILVNAVAPGATRTRAVSGDVPGPSVYNRAPIQRFAEPEEIAALVCFAASDECSFTTGHVLSADGGFTIAGVMEG
ncbi:MAG: SDR family NAD(P)-dependent oxidoreductase [Burkholderiaceae bacterium]